MSRPAFLVAFSCTLAQMSIAVWAIETDATSPAWTWLVAGLGAAAIVAVVSQAIGGRA